MCYPCKQCGRCKGNPGITDFCMACGAPYSIEHGRPESCPNCGYIFPVPKGPIPAAPKVSGAARKAVPVLTRPTAS